MAICALAPLSHRETLTVVDASTEKAVTGSQSECERRDFPNLVHLIYLHRCRRQGPPPFEGMRSTVAGCTFLCLAMDQVGGLQLIGQKPSSLRFDAAVAGACGK
jgi:hypothetical protein